MDLKLFKRFENIDELIDRVPERKRNSTDYLEKVIKYFLKMKTKYRRATKKELQLHYVAFSPKEVKKDLKKLNDSKMIYYKKRRKPLSLEDRLKIIIIKEEKNIDYKLNLIRNFDLTKDFYIVVELNRIK